MNKQNATVSNQSKSVQSNTSQHLLQTRLALALLPTATVLLVFALVDGWARQRLLFASLASSVFLIYLDPKHKTNSTRTLALAQGGAALIGWLAHALIGPGYWAAGGAMVIVIFGMILADAMHPPAVSTALSFAFNAGQGNNLALFGLCIVLIAGLVVLQRASLWLLRRTLNNQEKVNR